MQKNKLKTCGLREGLAEVEGEGAFADFCGVFIRAPGIMLPGEAKVPSKLWRLANEIANF